MKYIISLGLFVLSALASLEARADQATVEIDYLLTTMSNSECAFVRNGKRYDAKEAEEHLRMKLKRGKRYAPTTELFIERLASKSSMSGKLYFIECEDKEPIPSGEWLTELLRQHRADSS